jgi:hypothetical protein
MLREDEKAGSEKQSKPVECLFHNLSVLHDLAIVEIFETGIRHYLQQAMVRDRCRTSFIVETVSLRTSSTEATVSSGTSQACG